MRFLALLKDYIQEQLLIIGPNFFYVKFMYTEKATKFCKIFTLLLFYVVPVKGKVKISQNFVAFSELYQNLVN